MDLCQWIEGLILEVAAHDAARHARGWGHVEDRLAEVRRSLEAERGASEPAAPPPRSAQVLPFLPRPHVPEGGPALSA